LESETSLSENEDIVFSRNDDNELNFDSIKLKTLKTDDDDEISSTTSNDIEPNPQNEYIKTNFMSRATSITNKLSDTLNRLTSSPTTTILPNSDQDLTHLDQFQFPIQLFKKVCFF
jgi:hypothetical protein